MVLLPVSEPASPAPCGPPTRAGKRYVRRSGPKPRIPARRALRAAVAAEPLEAPDPVRPRYRAECADGARPCPWVSCPHHLYLEVIPPSRSEPAGLRLAWPHLEPDEIPETCALDVADRGGVTLEVVGGLLNLSRERVRQIERRALGRLRRKWLGLGLGPLPGWLARDGVRWSGAARSRAR